MTSGRGQLQLTEHQWRWSAAVGFHARIRLGTHGLQSASLVHDAEGWRADAAPALPVMLSAVKAAGFDAIHAEIPTGTTPVAYLSLLGDHGLEPAPGDFQASFAAPTRR